MTVSGWMRPREVTEAAATLFALTATAASVTAVFTVVAPGNSGSPVVQATTIAILASLTLAAWRLRQRPNPSNPGWASFPFFAIVAVLIPDLLTHDASLGAQVFLTLPVLYAGSQLPRGGVALVTAAAVSAELIIVFSELGATQAAMDASYLGATMITGAVLLVLSAERRVTLFAELERRAAIDPLTGLATRRVLDSAAQGALSGAFSVSGVALILLDVDRFKLVNDRYGHPAGDIVLVQLADLLRIGCRTADVLSRLGGDEIAILLPACSLNAAQRRAEEIRARVQAHPFLIGTGPSLKVSVSVGVAHAPTSAFDLPSLYAAADHALYVSKRAGRDRVSIARPSHLTAPA